MSIMKKLDVSLECGDLSPLLVPLRNAHWAWDQSADKSAHSKEGPNQTE